MIVFLYLYDAGSQMTNNTMARKQKELQMELSPEQTRALAVLHSGENVFLTGGAGCGKSYLVREFCRTLDPKTMPLLASTGAAAVLVGGRTFHGFFGLGIMEGGPAATFLRASEDARVLKRLRQVEGFILDEVSMIPGQALEIAEALARKARGSQLPWGGMRAIVVGDFAQLPPVTRGGARRDWAFLSAIWEKSHFLPITLCHNQRVDDADFLSVLQEVRTGEVGNESRSFLDARVCEEDSDCKAPRLFPRREQVETYNARELAELPGEEKHFDSIFLGKDQSIAALRRSGPLPERLRLKVGCQVLFLQNDPQKRWVNGTRGTVVDIGKEQLTVEKSNWRHVTVDRMQFSWLDAEGNAIASVINFPLMLGYATTIHKSQGSTMDKLWVNLSQLWEPGQAYVALSRLRRSSGLKLLSWSPKSFLVDPQVIRFYKSLTEVSYGTHDTGSEQSLRP